MSRQEAGSGTLRCVQPEGEVLRKVANSLRAVSKVYIVLRHWILHDDLPVDARAAGR